MYTMLWQDADDCTGSCYQPIDVKKLLSLKQSVRAIDIIYASKTAKITRFEPVNRKSPNAPLSYTELKSVQFWLILPKYACYGNSVSSLKISDSILLFADPENPTLHAKSVSTRYLLLEFWDPLDISGTVLPRNLKFGK